MDQTISAPYLNKTPKSELFARAVRMDTKGISMTSLIIGASGGIGAALAARLEAQGDAVTRLSRAAGDFDFSQPDSVGDALAALSGPFDRVIVATGKLDGAGHPPEKSLKALTAAALADQFAVNTIGPALILRELPRLLSRSKPAHVAVLTARVGSIGDNKVGGWYAYRAAKAATNQIVHTAAIELARTHKQACLISYHPGTVATKFTAHYQASHPTVSPDEAAQNLLGVLAGLSVNQSGGFYDWRGDEVAW